MLKIEESRQELSVESNEPILTAYALNCLCQLVPYTYKFSFFFFFGKIQAYLILY